MTAQKIRTGAVLFEAQKNGDVKITAPNSKVNGVIDTYMPTVSHLDTIRLAYWLTKQYIKGAAKRSEAGR